MQSILLNRIDNLIRHLEDAHDADTWYKKLELEDQEGLSIALWRGVLYKIYSEAENLIADLVDARERLVDGVSNESETWAAYERVLRSSESIFRECLELLGGLTLRARIVDLRIANIYRLSDALIQEAATNLATSTSFAIPAFEDAVSSTLRRVARVRFPEWTLWTLPLVAYEYAYVAMEEPALSHLPQYFANLYPQENLYPRDRTDVDSGRGWEQKDGAPDPNILRIRVLLADSLATYNIGPAYACAALLLRLQPIDNGNPTRPSDIDRAAMILGVLKRCDEQGRRLRGPRGRSVFSAIHGVLADRWGETLAGTDGAVELTPPLDPGMVLDNFRRCLIGNDKSFSPRAWNVAQSDAERLWEGLADDTAKLEFPDGNHGELQLRDVLNALWYARLGTIDRQGVLHLGDQLPPGSNEKKLIERLEEIGTEVCLGIEARARPPARPITPSEGRVSAGLSKVEGMG